MYIYIYICDMYAYVYVYMRIRIYATIIYTPPPINLYSVYLK